MVNNPYNKKYQFPTGIARLGIHYDGSGSVLYQFPTGIARRADPMLAHDILMKYQFPTGIARPVHIWFRQ